MRAKFGILEKRMKISYAVENLRSIEEMEPVELCPITLLVGANSSGKSTFLRSISLLRQSLDEQIDEPILWYKNNSVDFGSYETAVSKRKLENEIKFKFRLKEMPYPVIEFQESSDDLNVVEKYIDEINYNIFLNYIKNSVCIKKIEVHVIDYNLTLEIMFDDEMKKAGFVLNENPLTGEIQKMFSYNFNQLFDNIRVNKFNRDFGVSKKVNFNKIINNKNFEKFTEIMHDMIKSNLKLNLSDEILFKEAAAIANSYPIVSSFEEQKRSQPEINKLYDTLFDKKNKMLFEKIKRISEMNFLIKIQNTLEGILKTFFTYSTRIGPARAQLDDRFYRYQELNVTEISATGHNFPMLLYKLKSKSKLGEYSDWVNELIGYGIEIDGNFPNVEISVIENNFSMNLIDTGFGVSQILPILAQIWLNTIGEELQVLDNGKKQGVYPVLMEQPELHLHPFHQAKIADAIVNALNFKQSSKKDSQQLFIVETHSEAIINKLGALVRDGKISEEDVQILVFTKQASTNSTKVSVATYNDDGTLNNWPYGFFRYSNDNKN